MTLKFLLCLLPLVPIGKDVTPIYKREKRAFREWTAMGDSYASGVGAGPQPPDDTNRCFRFPNSYPAVLQKGEGALDPTPEKWNNVACSGNTFDQILDNEFLDEPKDDGKNGIRPVWGDAPEFVTLTMGGNDVGILNLVATCIYSFKPVGQGCDQIIKNGHDTLEKPEFAANAKKVIQKALDRGRGTSVGEKFAVFVSGYAQFFNQTTEQCDKVTFEPKWDTIKAEYLTRERRKDMNNLALALNKVLRDAAESFTEDQHVHYVDIDAVYNGHRFCDRDEPAPDDPETWFFNWYTKDDPRVASFFQNMAFLKATQEGGDTGIHTDADYINALYDAAGDDPEALSFLSDAVRVFHPTTKGHQGIRDAFKKAIAAAGLPDDGSGNGGDDGGVDVVDHGGDESTNNAHPKEQQCHGVSGDVWVDHAHKATEAIKEFCAQNDNPLEYYKDSENYMRLQLTNELDESKTIADKPDCFDEFQTQLIAGCDHDPSNNPHDYKFGGTYYSGDGWKFEFDALATQVNMVDCDVSYKVVYDQFELRGKNLPDSKFGANGEGLHGEVKGCGAITKWQFEWTPNDPTYEWFASGQLPLGTKGCVGRALESAGASGKGGC
ncbi:MAG: hypothetical protein L6R38_007018 [Xanthoria sp. 2 TBL-2021]|nr:MAG: hypothetical protein L6R38_007018 [Xanthoria sp. 2 TBL-2021]